MLRLLLISGIGLACYLGRFQSEWFYTWMGLDSAVDPARVVGILGNLGCVAVAILILCVICALVSEGQKRNEWFYRNFPRVWGRWWSARLLATTAFSNLLHEGNQDFTAWQCWKRNALCLRLFLLPGKLPLSISKKPITKQQQ